MIYLQKGGNPALLKDMIDINIFDKDSLEDYLLNPFNGILFTETTALKNYYLFGNEDYPIVILIKKLFTITDVIRPSLTFGTLKNIDLGRLIGILYFNYIDQINQPVQKEISIIIDRLKAYSRNPSGFNFEKIKLPELTIKEKYKNIKFYLDYNKLREESLLEETYKLDGVVNVRKIKDFMNKLNEFNKIYTELIELLRYPEIAEFLNIIKTNWKNLEDKFQMKEMFMVILSLVWWFSNNKEGIQEYYLGLQEILGKEIVDIPTDFLTIKEYELDIPTFDNEFLRLINNGIQALHYSTAKYKEIDFPDCGETSLRNFINIIVFDISTGECKIEN